MNRALIILVFALLALICAAHPPALAQVPATTNGTEAVKVPVEQLEQLKATLNDEGKRAKLIADIDALIAASKAPSGEPEAEAGKLGQRVIGVIGEAREGFSSIEAYLQQVSRDAAQVSRWTERIWQNPDRRQQLMETGGVFAGIFLVGWLVEYGIWLLLTPIRRRLMRREPASLLGRIGTGLQRAVIELVSIVGFLAAAAAFGVITGSATALNAAALTLAATYGAVRVVLAGGRLLLAPKAANLRIAKVTTPTAVSLYRWLRCIVVVVATVTFAVLAYRMAGLPAAGERLLMAIAVLTVSAVLIAFILAQRHRWRAWLIARAERGLRVFAPPRLVLARIGPPLAIAVVVGLTAAQLLRVKGGTEFIAIGVGGSVLTLLLGSFAFAAVGRASERARERLAEFEGASPWQQLGPYLPAIAGIGKALVLVIMVLGFLQSWGADAVGWVMGPAGQHAAGSTVSILIVLAVAAVVWQMAKGAIASHLERADSAGGASSRARTLLPLLRKVLFIVLAFIVGMVVLSELGVAIGPMLAGAGIVGVAIGFGSQRLVQDVITGIFILIENAVSIGDVVNVAGIGGLVEDMSIRSIRLRDLSGNVHTIPFSSVTTVTNMTKDFSFYLLDIGVAYREDTDEVVEVCRQIVEQMRDEPEFAPFILEPLEVLGVDQFADSAVIIKARIKTPPIKQWMVGREFNRRMKKRFDELGIEIPFPHQTIYFGVDKHGGAPAAPIRIDPGAGALAASKAVPDVAAETVPDPSPAISPPVSELPAERRPSRPNADRKD